MTASRDISRLGHYAERVVFVDGQWGCGKTLFSPIIAALKRVELLTYAYEIEHICSLYYLNKISMDASMTMVKMLTDLQLYNTMMGRETNFRPTDLSSVLMDADPWRYFHRLFIKGDEYTPARITAQQPILHLTTHNLLAIADPVFEGLGHRAVVVEIVRHPLYMIKQQYLNMERIIEDPRDFSIYFRWGERSIPFWSYGWEEKYVHANNMENAIYVIEHYTHLTEVKKKLFKDKYQASIVTVPFELFVLDPWPYMRRITQALGAEVTARTRRVIKKQNVPRKRIADGIGLAIYKRCGWVPPQVNATERDELNIRRNFAAQGACAEAMAVLDRLSQEYEERYMRPLL